MLYHILCCIVVYYIVLNSIELWYYIYSITLYHITFYHNILYSIMYIYFQWQGQRNTWCPEMWYSQIPAKQADLLLPSSLSLSSPSLLPVMVTQSWLRCMTFNFMSVGWSLTRKNSSGRRCVLASQWAIASLGAFLNFWHFLDLTQ